MRGALATHFELATYRRMFAAQVQSSISPSLAVGNEASVLTPELGLLHTFGSGSSIGAKVCAQIAPSQVDFSTQVPASVLAQVKTQYLDPNDARVRSPLDQLGRTPLAARCPRSISNLKSKLLAARLWGSLGEPTVAGTRARAGLYTPESFY